MLYAPTVPRRITHPTRHRSRVWPTLTIPPLPPPHQVVTRVPKATQGEMQDAVDAAKEAFKTWSRTSVLTRQQIMFNFQNLIKSNMKALAASITQEQGKTLADAEGDVVRGLREWPQRE